MVGAGRETEQALVARLAQIRDRVFVDVRVTDAAARERLARAAECDQTPVLLEQLFVPRVGTVPRHRAPSVLAPLALEAELVAGEHHRHPGRRHLQADAD